MGMKKVLVVDNNPVFLSLLQHLLIKKGYQVWTAENSLNALDIVEKIRPSIIFIDLIMPNIDGEKLCRKIRESSRQKKTRIILVSALAAEQEINYSEWGFDACIAKGPFDQMAKGIISLLDQLEKSKNGLTETKIGFNNIYPREITRELLAIKGSLETILSSVSEGILEITNESRILYVNPAAVGIVGKSEMELLASDFLKLFKDSCRQKVAAALKSAPSNGSNNQNDFILRNGKKVSLSAAHAGKDTKKRIIVISDVTEKRLAEYALRRHADFEKLITDISTQFINLPSERLGKAITAALKKIGRFAGVDRCYVFALSDARRKMVNTHLWCAKGVILQPSAMREIDFQDRFPWYAENIENHKIIYFSRIEDLPDAAIAEKKEYRKQGIQSLVNVPMVSGGELQGVVGFDCVTEPKDWPEEMISLLKIVGEIFVSALNRGIAEKALRDSERKYRELADLLPQVVFETDTEGNLTFANRQAFKYFGASFKNVKKVNALDFITAEDRPRAVAHFQRVLKGENLAPPEFSFVNKDGSISSMLIYSSQVRYQNETIGIRGIANDITERKRWEDLYRSLAEKTFTGVYVVVNGRFKYMNPRFAAFTGYDAKELAELQSISLIHPEDKKDARKNATDMLKGKRKSPYEFRLVRKDGSIVWATETVSSIYYEGQLAVLGNVMDLTERKTAEQQLHYLSTHDSLTDLYNRAYFETEIKRMEQGRRFPIHILMADVDFLKKTNDTHGHAAGDDLLRRAATVLKQVFRKEDVVARIGGDEFAAVWTDSGQSSEVKVLRRIRKSLSEHNSRHRDFPLALSIGIVSGHRGCSVNKLMQEADKKMYEEKFKGRNSVSG